MYCPFCNELATGLVSEEFDVAIESRTIAETDHFSLIADISPLAPGHVLMIPKTHFLNFASVREAEQDELFRFISQAKAVISSCYSAPIIMEHGSSTCSDGGACIAHAHLQIFPSCIDMAKPLSRFEVHPIDSWRRLAEWSNRDEPYLFLQDCNDRMFVAANLAGIEKQFIRIEIARSIGLQGSQWDWRRHVFAENLYETVGTLRDAWGKI